jgi:hypothetical protein
MWEIHTLYTGCFTSFCWNFRRLFLRSFWAKNVISTSVRFPSVTELWVGEVKMIWMRLPCILWQKLTHNSLYVHHFAYPGLWLQEQMFKMSAFSFTRRSIWISSVLVTELAFRVRRIGHRDHRTSASLTSILKGTWKILLLNTRWTRTSTIVVIFFYNKRVCNMLYP